RWPSEERRAALRHVLRVHSDDHLDLFSPRRSATPHTSDAGRQVETWAECRQVDASSVVDVDDVLMAGGPETVVAWLGELDRLTQLAGPGISAGIGTRLRAHLDILNRLQADGTHGHLAGVDARWSEFTSWISDNTG